MKHDLGSANHRDSAKCKLRSSFPTNQSLRGSVVNQLTFCPVSGLAADVHQFPFSLATNPSVARGDEHCRWRCAAQSESMRGGYWGTGLPAGNTSLSSPKIHSDIHIMRSHYLSNYRGENMEWILLACGAAGLFYFGSVGSSYESSGATSELFSDDDASSLHHFDNDDYWANRSSLFDDTATLNSIEFDEPSINPANGLPMMGCLDIEGNPYGTDMHSMDDMCSSSSSSFEDCFSSTSSFDDSFSSSSMFDS